MSSGLTSPTVAASGPTPAETKADTPTTSPDSVAVGAVAGTTPTEEDDLGGEDLEEKFSERLGSIVKGISAHYTCGGTIETEGPPTVHMLETNEAIVIEPPKEKKDPKSRWRASNEVNKELLQLQGGHLEPLISKTPRAGFGHGQKTVYDDSVRNALQLKAEEFEIDIPHEKIDQILATIKQRLGLTTEIVAERYSLNIYQNGGHFKKHKDTPRGADMLGTLVICLPSYFTGGAMTVSLGHTEHRYFTPPGYWTPSPPNPQELRWCTFFADVDHQIHKVESGVRVTLAYLLRRKDLQSAAANLPREIKGLEQANRISEEFAAALRARGFLEDGGKVGFPCLHLYTNKDVFTGKKDCTEALTAKQISKLKGRDLMVAQAAASAGLSLRLVPYLGHSFSDDCDYSGGYFPLKKYPRKKRTQRYMSDDSIESFFDSDGQKKPWEDADIWVLNFSEGAEGERFGATEWNHEGYFGNEASHTEFYVKTALFVEVPPFTDRSNAPTGEVGISEPARKRTKA